MEDQNDTNIASLSYSSCRRRIRQSVADSWQQIVDASCKINEVLKVHPFMVPFNNDYGQCEPQHRTRSYDVNSGEDQSCDQWDYERNNSGDDLHSEDKFESDISEDIFESDIYSIGESDSDPEMDFITDGMPIGTKLAEWAMNHNITHSALTDLLAILREYHPGLPVDPRTLLHTPRNYIVREFAQQQGHYYHFGISGGLQGNSSLYTHRNTKELRLQFNFDGLPLFKSSSCELWPILCLVKGAAIEPYVVGLYCGTKKPQSLDEYLKEFVSDLRYLLDNGITVGDHHFDVKIDCFVCDAPARAFIKNVKSFSGYYGCDKCSQEGEYIDRRMTFPQCNAPLRTDEEFDCCSNEEHHRGSTPLSALGFGLVTGFVLDYMHLVCLGVMRKLLLFWLRGPLRKGDMLAGRLPSCDVDNVSGKLMSLTKFVPREFARKPRSLTDIDRWKATELRAFLLYFGPVVLSGVLSCSVYSHYMLLSTAITLLANPELCMQFNDYANQLLETFVEQAKSLYGREFIVYNVHALVHLSADVKRFGPLDAFSAFPFENQLQCLKRLVRKAEMPLSQIVRRISERQRFTLHMSPPHSGQSCSVLAEHYNGPVPVGYEHAQQFRQLRRSGFILSLSHADNCIAVSGIGPMQVQNILKMNSDIVLVCKTYQKTCDLYQHPFPSSSIGIVLASELSSQYTIISAEAGFCKCVCLPAMGNSSSASHFAIIPLLHHHM